MLEESMEDNDTKAKVISKYLQGWEKRYGLSFQRPKNDTMTKISGLRYIMWWFPKFVEEALSQGEKIDDKFVGSMIDEIEACIGSEHSIFEMSVIFRSEGATDTAVKQHIELWTAYHINNKQKPKSLL